MPSTSRDNRLSELDFGHLKQHNRADHTSATQGWVAVALGRSARPTSEQACDVISTVFRNRLYRTSVHQSAIRHIIAADIHEYNDRVPF